MSAPLLSATLIVRDEERNLRDCLGSIDGVVDEVVVVDTGSTDGSVEIARELGARVDLPPWRGDFSEARNVALEEARGEWILYLDADERLRPVDRDASPGGSATRARPRFASSCTRSSAPRRSSSTGCGEPTPRSASEA